MRKHRPTQGALVVALTAAIIAIYLAIIPPLQGFDSVAHFNFVNYLRQHRDWPAINPSTAAYSYQIPQQPPLYYTLAAGAAAWLPFERADEWTRQSDNPYQMTLSPLWTVNIPAAPRSWHLAARIAQGVSALGGLLAVIFTLAWVRLVLPAQWHMHIFTVAIVALNPLFLYLSVTPSNDAWAVAGATVLAWAGAWLARNPQSRWLAVFGIGCLCGLALLTKYSAGLGALAGLTAFVLLRDLRVGSVDLKRVIAFITGVLLTASAWFGTNAITYGELIPMRAAAQALPGLNRPTPLSLTATLAEIPGLLKNYWGVFIGTVDADVYYGAMILLTAFGVLGLLTLLPQRRRVHRDTWAAVAICTVWVTSVSFAVLWWVRTISFGGHARLLLVASPAVALLLALGWQQLANALPAQSRSIARSALLGALLLLPLLPLPAFMRNYAKPLHIDLAETNMGRVINARYDEGMILAGIDLPHGPFISSQRSSQREMPLTLYFTSDAGIEGFYTLFVHLVDAEGRVLFAFDGVPFGGRHTTRQWRVGEAFADTYTLSLPADFDAQSASLLRLVAGVYPHDQPNARLVAHDGKHTPLGGEVLLAQVRVVGDVAKPMPVSSPLAEWDNGIALTAATLHEDASGVTVQTLWQTRAPANRDVTLFVHLLDANGQLVAQQDQPPHLPASVWLAGEIITDTIIVQMSKSAQWTTAVIGLYDAASGERAKFVSGTADHVDDRVVLRRR